ncbi:MAG: PKD domain-containing protein, partial [Bacteroidota bacterium]|nr:PKD domain-containing protein [Bacteroidota bacterium]
SLRGTCNIYNNKVRSIHNNSLTATNDVIGISAAVHTTGAHELYIFNNFVSGINSSYNGAGSAIIQAKGIYIQPAGGGSSSTIHVDFNNVGIQNTSLLISSACFETGTATGPVINTRNNIFVNSTAAQSAPAAHFCIVTPSTNTIGSAGSVSDYNDLFITNPARGFIGKGNSTTYTTFTNWQTAFSSDALSLNIDPMFATVLDLHVLNTALSAAGMNLAWVPMDIDNQVRGPVPDLGADETFPPDPSPVDLLSPTASTCYTSTESVIVRVLNAGDALLDFTQDTVPVILQITGAITQTITVYIDDNSANNGDPLPIGGYVDISFGTINMSASGTYVFNVHTALSIDGNPYNDTLAPVTIVVESPQVSISGNSLICPSASTLLTANASGGDGNYSYQWSYGLGTNSSVIVNPSQDSTFYVSVTDGCGMFANDSIVIQTLPDPTADFSYTTTNNVVTFTDNSQNTSGWSWDFGDAQSSVQQNPTHTYTTNGTYTVILTATNNCGTATDTAVISIITTGLDALSGSSMTVFPNPVTGGSFTVYLPEAENNLVIEIEDMNGKLLRKKEFGNTMGGMSFVTDISGFENGIYLLRVSSDAVSEVQKIVIEK